MEAVVENKVGYKQTKLGWIPDLWDVVTFKDISKINQGLQIAISERHIEHIPNSHFYITNEFLKANSQYKYYVKTSSDSVLCSKNDILMTRTGNTGQVVTNVEGAFHNNFFKINYDKDRVGRLFLYYYLTSSKTQYLISQLAGTSTIPDLNHSDFYRIPIPLPPLPEQKKIAEILSTWDKSIEQLQNLISEKQKLKKGLMQQLLTGKKRFTGFTDEWKEVKLGDILKIGSGKDYKHLADGEIPVYGTGGLMTYVDSFLYDGKSVGIGRKGTIDKPVFLEGKFWTVDTLFFTHSFKDTTPEFVYFLFLTINWKKYNEASGLPSLSKKTIEKIRVKIPVVDEQERISKVFLTLDKEIDELLKKLSNLREQKKGLMQKLLTGEVRVNF